MDDKNIYGVHSIIPYSKISLYLNFYDFDIQMIVFLFPFLLEKYYHNMILDLR